MVSRLDGALSEIGVELDSIDINDVFLVRSSENDISSTIAISLDIKAQYSELDSDQRLLINFKAGQDDFDMIVQDSINSDTHVIQRDLKEYNLDCREQMYWTENQGKRSENDYSAVVSTSGAARPGSSWLPLESDLSNLDDIYSTACSSEYMLP